MTPIYHITHLDNLKSMIDCGGLYCDGHVSANGIAHHNIAYEDIKERRARTQVPVGPKGTLADYVPFYFAPRSPMLYVNSRGGIEGGDGQGLILHLVSEAETIRRAGLGFVFTDGHAVMTALSKFYADLRRLDQIDWEVMESRYWNDTNEQPDRKRRRQAEFLAHSFVSWHHISRVGVLSREVAGRVEELIQECEHKPVVEVRRDWYY